MPYILIGIWLILFGVMSLVTVEVPKWIVPVLAIIVGIAVCVRGLRKTP